MKINLGELNEKEIISTSKSIPMRLSKNAAAMVFQMFTKNIYSNPIGSVVREITSNCFDSHVEAYVKFPVIIRKSYDQLTDTYYLSFIDKGVGMSPDRIENIYGVYFESTKNDTDDQIGGFGIGGKTPLAYKRYNGSGDGEYDNSFYVITNHNNTKYSYCIYEGNSEPIIDPLYSEPTAERNGTEIRIPVLKKDLLSFKREMVRQLYYFENVIFEGFEEDTDSIKLSNDYQIVRGKSFFYRGNEYSNYVHVCLGRVAYPIDYNTLGLYEGNYKFPVAIKLNIGEINVTANRESLDYSEKTIKILKDRLQEVRNELVEMLVNQYENIITLEDFFRVKNKFGHLHLPNGTSFYVGDNIKQSEVNFKKFKFNSLTLPSDVTLFNFFFKSEEYGKKSTGRRRQSSHRDSFTGSYEQLTGRSNILYFEGEFKRKVIKQSYLKFKHERYYIITPKDLINSKSLTEAYDVFGTIERIYTKDTMELTEFGKSLYALQNEFMTIVRKHCQDYNTFEVPADYQMSRKKGTGLTSELLESTIPVKLGDEYYRERIKLKTLFELKCPIFYGTVDEEGTVNTYTRMFEGLFGYDKCLTYSEYSHSFGPRNNDRKNKKAILFITISKNNVKYMQYCHNAMPISEFKIKMLYRKEQMVREYFQSKLLKKEYDQISRLYICEGFKNVSPVIYYKLKSVRKVIEGFDYDQSIDNYETSLKNFFGLNNLKINKAELKHVDTINDVLELQKNNEETLKYINIPHYLDDNKEAFWNLLKKVLVF